MIPKQLKQSLDKNVKPFVPYMVKMLRSDGYNPANNLPALTVQFHNIYKDQVEEILKQNPDAGFFKDVWNGVQRGFNSVVGIVESIGSSIGNIGAGLGGGLEGLLSNLPGMTGGMVGGGNPAPRQQPKEDNTMQTILIFGAVGIGAYLLLKSK